MEKEIAQLKERLASGSGRDLASEAIVLAGGIRLVAASVEGADAASLRTAVDQLKAKLGSASIIVLGSAAGSEKVALIAGVSDDLTTRVKAGEIVNFVAQQVGGKGGGRADLAQAGGTRPEGLPDALAGLAAWLGTKLA
jgi:alanyl-tRNA synthetase